MPGTNFIETQRMIEREDERLAQSTGMSVRLTRRALLARTAGFAAAWTICPWRISVPSAFAQGTDSSSMTQTLEAFADTMIPGEKRFPTDRAIAGVVSGAGAVQAGAIEMMNLAFLGALPDLAKGINAFAVLYAIEHGIVLTLTVPPFVELDFASRTDLLVQVLDSSVPDIAALFYGLASVCFLAYHTAAFLPTVNAIRNGHPGLAVIGFPPPDPDGVWRFPEFSYRRVLARAHRHSKHGNPA